MITNNHLFTLQNLRFLLENVLVSYVTECGRHRPKQGELNRLEGVFKEVFRSMAKDLLETVEAPRYREIFRETPWLDGVLKDMQANNETAEFAIHRFILAHRYPTPKSV